jgi:hypothetical protein
VFDSRNPGGANSRAADTARRRVNVDQDFRFGQAQAAQDILSIGFDCTRHSRVIRCQHKLNAGFGAG